MSRTYAFGALPPAQYVQNVAASLVGKTLDEATAAAEKKGMIVRAMRSDGVPCRGTTDARPIRINVATQDGTVTEILSVG